MLTIGFELEGEGRATVVLAGDLEAARIPVTDASDPLADLTQGVLGLLTGQREAHFSTFDPPAEHLWHLEQVGRGAVAVEITRAEGCLDLDPGAPVSRVLQLTCPLSELAQALSRALETIARSHGVAGYEQIWASHPFPAAARSELRSRLRRGR